MNGKPEGSSSNKVTITTSCINFSVIVALITHSFYLPPPGTRGSFIKAFQVFEEREQVVIGNVERSASVRNTMKLHSNVVKNALATTRSPNPDRGRSSQMRIINQEEEM